MSQRWIALSSAEALPVEVLGWWALQFTPRVAQVGPHIVMELQASVRLFGGAARLYTRLVDEAQAMGSPGGRLACTAGAALACLHHDASWSARRHQDWDTPVSALLDPLPLSALSAVAAHQHTLAPLGCRTLGDVRRLPRGGLSRRFGAGLLQALDQAYGRAPEVFEWLHLPERFEQRLDLPGRVAHAQALLHAAEHLLRSMCAWLAGRQAGVSRFTLRWQHDGARHHKETPGQIVVPLADPTRDLQRLTRLLDEHLRRTTLLAPVDTLWLTVDEIRRVCLHSQDLFGELDRQTAAGPARLRTPSGLREHRQHLHALLERLSVRLGASQVCQGQLRADHRPEQAQQWQPMTPDTLAGVGAAPPEIAVDPLPQPGWLLPEPRQVALASLRLLAGPHRIEAGWWDAQGPRMARDYFIAHHAQIGLLWVFRERALPESGRPRWFVHGLFA